MASFSVNQILETPVGRLRVETRTASDTSGAITLRPGVHRFQLVVVNDQGVQSDPVIAAVRVTQPILQPIVEPIVQPILQPIIVQPTMVGPEVVSPRSKEVGGRPTKRRQSTKSKPARESKSSKKPKPAPKR